MILHLLWDEKITGRVIKTFETVFPGKNRYLIWTATDTPRFVTKSEHSYFISNGNNWPAMDYSIFTKIFIHALDYDKIEFCCECISPDIPIYWAVWGNDLYNLFLYGRGYELYYKSHPPFSLRNRLGKLVLGLGFNNKRRKMILNFLESRKVNMLCYEEEFNLFRKYYPKASRHIKHIKDYFYYPIDEILGSELIHSTAKGNIILVGNSCSWTNNHEYVFDKIKGLDLKGKKIVTPLSYSGNEDYRNKIIRTGKNYFGDRYEPLTEFLPLGQYNQLMSEAEVCLYGTWRQEAVGNITISLYLGAKVFVSEKNPVIDTFRRQGLALYTLESIDEESLHTPFPDFIKQRNREIIFKNNNWEKLQQLTQDIFS